MPVAGRKPKPEDQRRNRVKPVHDWVEVEDVPFEEGPRLPRSMPNGLPWSAATKRWWKTVSAMPHCVLWTESDWQFALDTAFIAGQFHLGHTQLGGELRQREKILGTTVDARRDLRIRYIEPGSDQAEESEPTAIGDYRSRLEAVT